MNKKIFLAIFGMIFLFGILANVSASGQVNILTTDSGWNSDSGGAGNAQGVRATANQNQFIMNITVSSSHNPTTAYIVLTNGTLLGTATFSGNFASFSTPPYVPNGASFNILAGSTSAWNGGYKSVSHPLGSTTFFSTTERVAYTIGSWGTPTLEQATYLFTLVSVGVEQNYNSGVPSITLNSPPNEYNSSTNLVSFNATVTDNLKVQNVSIYIDGILNETNSSNFNGTYIFNKSLSEGFHNWSILAFDNESQSVNSSTYNLTIDTTNPIVSITSPSGAQDYLATGSNLTLNFTATDTHLSTCIFEYNSVNTTVPCSSGVLKSYYFNYSVGQNYGLLYVNDAAGNLNLTNVSWSPIIKQNSLSYFLSELGGVTTPFILNFSVGSGYHVTTPILVYNGTNYPSSFTGSNPYLITKFLTTPYVTTSTNYTFYFLFPLSNGDQITSETYTQTISPILIDNCSSYTNKIFNFTIYDEESLSKLTNSTIEYAFNFYNPDRSILALNLSGVSYSNPTSICFSTSLTNSTQFSLDGTLKYYANQTNGSSYIQRYYNFLNYTITNQIIPRNISLYSLLEASSTSFKLTFRDSSLVLGKNILVTVQKQYLQDNDFKTVEIPLTDSSGNAILNLIPSTSVYNIIMTNLAGSIVGTFNRVIPYCQNPSITECELELNAPGTDGTYYSYSKDVGINFLVSFNNNTKIISTTFNSINSLSPTVRMKVLSQNQFENQTICDTSLISSTGVLTCNATSASLTNRFLFVEIYSNGKLAGVTSIDLYGKEVGGDFGEDGFVYAFLIFLFIILLFSDDRQTLVFSVIIGWVLIISLGLLKGSLFSTPGIAISGGIWLIISAIILVWKIKSEEVGGTA